MRKNWHLDLSDQSLRDGNTRRFTLKSSGKVYKTEICETVR